MASFKSQLDYDTKTEMTETIEQCDYYLQSFSRDHIKIKKIKEKLDLHIIKIDDLLAELVNVD